MDFSKLNLLSGLTQRLQFLSARSSVLAENIANADTPDYVGRDIRAGDFKTMLSTSGAMRVSDARHIPSTSPASRSYRTIETGSNESALDGNRVSIETETMKLSQTRMEYGLASTVYRKSLDMVRLAIRSDR